MRGLSIRSYLPAIVYRCTAISLSLVGATLLAGVPSAAAIPKPLPEFTTASSSNRSAVKNQAAASLARHLKQIKARMYGAFWCPYCQRQMDLFGRDVFTQHVQYIECDPRGQGAQPKLCKDAKITGFPTWEINGKRYQGMQSLEELAKLSGYRGPRNF